MEPDIIIADIAGQALDIFLHGPESAHKNGIVKAFTHTSIPIQPRKLLKKKRKKSTHQTRCLPLVVLFLSMWWWATARKLGTCSTSEALLPGTILTENICENVQQILQHSQAEKNVQLTKHDAFIYWSSSCPVCWWATFTKLSTCSTLGALS